MLGEERVLAEALMPGGAEAGLVDGGEARSSASAAFGDADLGSVGVSPREVLVMLSDDERFLCMPLPPSTGVVGESVPSATELLRLSKVPSSSWLTSEFCRLFFGRAVCEKVSSGSCSCSGTSAPGSCVGGVQEILMSSTNRLRIENSELRVPPVETSLSRW